MSMRTVFTPLKFVRSGMRVGTQGVGVIAEGEATITRLVTANHQEEKAERRMTAY